MAHVADLCASLLDVVKCRNSPGKDRGGVEGGDSENGSVICFSLHTCRACFGVQWNAEPAAGGSQRTSTGRSVKIMHIAYYFSYLSQVMEG